jgi:hypothetical protein
MLQWLLHDFQPYIPTKTTTFKNHKTILLNEKNNWRVTKTRRDGYGKRQMEIEKVCV